MFIAFRYTDSERGFILLLLINRLLLTTESNVIITIFLIINKAVLRTKKIYVYNNENAKIEILLTKASFFRFTKTLLMFVYLVFNKLILLQCPGNATQWKRPANKIITLFRKLIKSSGPCVPFSPRLLDSYE